MIEYGSDPLVEETYKFVEETYTSDLEEYYATAAELPSIQKDAISVTNTIIPSSEEEFTFSLAYSELGVTSAATVALFLTDIPFSDIEIPGYNDSSMEVTSGALLGASSTALAISVPFSETENNFIFGDVGDFMSSGTGAASNANTSVPVAEFNFGDICIYPPDTDPVVSNLPEILPIIPNTWTAAQQIYVGSSVTFIAVAHDPQNSWLKIKWLVDGSIVSEIDSGKPFTYTFSSAKSYKVKAFAVDADGNSVFGEYTVNTIKLPNVEPTLSFSGPASVYINENQAYILNASDSDGTIVSIKIKLNDAIVLDVTNSTKTYNYTYNKTFSTVGNYTLVAEIKDSDDVIITKQININAQIRPIFETWYELSGVVLDGTNGFITKVWESRSNALLPEAGETRTVLSIQVLRQFQKRIN
jgi:hypothetical protein